MRQLIYSSIGGGNNEVMSSFCYWGSVVECHGCINEGLTTRMSRTAAVFEVLHKSVFSDGSLSIL